MRIVVTKKDKKIFTKKLKLMGNQFQLSAVSDSEDKAMSALDAAIAEISRIEKWMTTYSEESETALINRQAGIAPVEVREEMLGIIERSIRISKLTQGAFDISYGSVDKSLWNFDTQMKSLPDSQTARQLVRLVNYRNIILDPEKRTVFLKEKGMRIGFGGIGKGYAAERGKLVMQAAGIESGIVNASGDMTVWGLQPDGRPWTIGIIDSNLSGDIFSNMQVNGLAIATSGNFEKYVIIAGKKYSDTINPRTGLPITGIKSVTIIGTNAEITDAMATPVMIMGVGPGMYMIDHMKDIEAIIVDDNDRVYKSANIYFSHEKN